MKAFTSKGDIRQIAVEILGDGNGFIERNSAIYINLWILHYRHILSCIPDQNKILSIAVYLGEIFRRGRVNSWSQHAPVKLARV
jgi:hypothetical protein